MTIRKALSSAVAASLVIGAAASAASVGAETLRQPANVEEAENLGGIGIGWIVALVVAAGVALVIIEDDEPSSP